MTTSPLSLSRQALIKVGASPITSLQDGSLEARVADALYPSLRDALLSEHPWSFASTTVTLDRHVTDQGKAIDAHDALPRTLPRTLPRALPRYALPKDFLRALSCARSLSSAQSGNSSPIPYQIIGKFIHADSSQLFLSYIRRIDEIDFPPFFQHVLIERLTAEFCLPLTENSSRAQWLVKRAQFALQQAKRIDSQQDRPSRIEDFTLIDVRH